MIIEIILRATRMSQGELADYLGVSRASINAWRQNMDTMTNSSKNLISEKFNFPISYFDIDLVNNKNMIGEIYKYIKNNWQIDINNFSDVDFVNQIIDEIEDGVEEKYKGDDTFKLTNTDIIDALCGGYNPFTGEVYNGTHILNNQQVKNVLIDLKDLYGKKSKIILTKDELNDKDREMFEELRAWRWDKTVELNYFNAYIVFTDKELINIVTANIHKKEDLLNVPGIGVKKYQNYGEELFEILKNGYYKKKDSFQSNSVINNNSFNLTDADLPF